MSVLSTWCKLSEERKQALYLLRNGESQFEAIADLCGFNKQDMTDLKLLIHELATFAPFVMQGPTYTHIEGKEDSKETERSKEFKYDSDFDYNGIIYWIGTQRGQTTKWVNPHDAKTVIVTISSKLGEGTLSNAIARQCATMYTQNEPNSWAVIDFQALEIKPTVYTLRHGYTAGDAYLMNWRLEGMRINKNKWEVLRRHKNEITLKCAERTHSWKIDCHTFYTKFRIIQYGANNRPDNYLCLSGFEIYGTVKL